MVTSRRVFWTGGLALAASTLAGAEPAWAESAKQINSRASTALGNLYASQPKARDLGHKARAILIFPRIYKAGFLVGGQSGNGVLRTGGKATAYYNITAASYGLQAGVQWFSLAMFFMTDTSLDYLRKSDGWAIGSGPSLAVIDKGAARSFTSTTLSQDVYAFPFGQKGLMAGLGMEGSKITRYNPS
jgi:lipid-binding SYLF domain-containing protein